MKKTLAIILAAIMLISVFAMSGCGDTGIVGKWSGEIDMSAMMEDYMAQTGQDVDTSFAKLTIEVEFKEDGTDTMTVNEASVDKFIDGLMDTLMDMARKAAEEQGSNLEDELGMSETEFRELMKQQLEGSMELPEAETSNYKLDENKLYGGEDEEELEENISEGNYTEIKLEGNTLTMVAVHGEEAEGEFSDMITEMLPITFKRIG